MLLEEVLWWFIVPKTVIKNKDLFYSIQYSTPEECSSSFSYFNASNFVASIGNIFVSGQFSSYHVFSMKVPWTKSPI